MVRLTRWIGSHLVLLGFLGFALWAYAWRGPLLGALGGGAAPPAAPQPVPSTVSPQDRPAAATDTLFRPPPQQSVPAEPAVLEGPDLLQSARRAYWNGDVAAAEARYRRYLADYPDDPAGYGELGNVLHSIGRDAEAHAMWREAALRLRAVGDDAAADTLLQLLGGDPTPAQGAAAGD